MRVLLAALLGLVLATIASPAFAHDELIGIEPAADAAVAAPPDELVLTFSGVLIDEPGATTVAVVDSSCASLASGDPVLDGTKLTQPLSPAADGVVTVQWRVVSSDGHPISGEYAFTVGSGGPTEPCAGAPEDEPETAGFPWAIVIAVVGVVAVGLGGALVYVLVARLRGRRED